MPLFLKKLFGKRKVIRIPLEFDAPPKWTENDRKALGYFMRSGVGRQLRQILYHEVMGDALRVGLKNDYQQGIADGKNTMVARILSLAETDEDTDKE